MHWLDYAIFVVYMLATAAVGSLFFKRKSSVEGYLQAGHQMHWSVVAISLTAALLSGISFLGAPSEAFHHGLVYTWTLASIFIATPIAVHVFLPFYFRMKLFSVYEYLEKRFDLRVRTICSLLFIIRTCVWLALAIYAPALAFAEIVGLPLWLSVVITGLGTTVYTALGGMKAVIWTEVMQFCVLFFGVVVIVVMATNSVPGGFLGAWNLASAEGRTQLFDFSLDPYSRMTFWGALLGGVPMMLASLVTDQMSVQRYMTSPSLRAGQRAMWIQMLLTVPVTIVFYLVGTVLFGFYEAHPERLIELERPDRIFPYFVMKELPIPMPGLLVAAVFAATMSTVSGGLNALATVTLADFTVRFQNHKDEESQTVLLARALTVGFGLLITVAAIIVGRLGTVIEAIGLMGGLLSGPTLGIFLLAVFTRRSNGSGALVGAATGMVVVLTVATISEVSFMWHTLISTLVTVIVGYGFSFAFPKPSSKQLDRYVYSRSRPSASSFESEST